MVRLRHGLTLLIAGAVSLPGGAWAHGGNRALVHSCVNRAGKIRILSSTSSCRPRERALDWQKRVVGPGP